MHLFTESQQHTVTCKYLGVNPLWGRERDWNDVTLLAAAAALLMMMNTINPQYRQQGVSTADSDTAAAKKKRETGKC